MLKKADNSVNEKREIRLIEVERTAKTIFVLSRRWLKLMQGIDIGDTEVPEIQIMHKSADTGRINYFKLIIDHGRKRVTKQHTTLSELRNLKVADLVKALKIKKES